ncbi:toxin glutamine deamidase domain-containing protein [Streptomyces sp. B-S-A8]|uniref:Toxin glutamine deamidase domain-containing protein n=1 Tax=Streptomyces solicavernae TaxID=3043614 RepID=A0ABT6S2E2_9ACTN|nr:toxin glutamine deamidase domain-containing protein [Streptomyces sp. B-S-A8]MDI3390750.1 toxin glutamine deamidase domain-containing protein [Streptomyces sp. B-S-A8]
MARTVLNRKPPSRQDNPTTPPVERINGDGSNTPGRNNNCVDTALSTVDTYAGNPTAAGARTPDPDNDGTPSDRGERGGRDRIENTLGARFNDLGNGRDAYNRLENTLRNNGHGSQAVIITQDTNGRAHAWNAVNHNGKITYIDAQTGQRSPHPLHNGNNGVFAIPLDSDRRPITSTNNDKRTRSDAGRQPDRGTNEHPINVERRPDATPAGAAQEQPDKPYSDPHDRGDSDTSEESRRVTEDGPDSDTSRTHETAEGKDSKEYGLEPDALQQKLRHHRDVHRVELDRVHHRLESWASSGELANVLRSTENNSAGGPQRFTRDQLSESLDGFDRLSRGEQQAAVASIARLSLSFHEAHSVGNNPESLGHPYRGPNEGEPAEDAKDRGAKMAQESLGVSLHRRAVNGLFKLSRFKKLSHDDAETVRDHGPDFSGKNFAVLEVKGPPPKNAVTYIADSSVPANQPGVSPRHSERHLLDWLERVDPESNRYTPLGLYTEREPCGKGQGHMGCANVLQHERFNGAPIHYSMTYRDDPAGIAQRDQQMAANEQKLTELEDLSDKQVRQQMKEEWSETYKDNPRQLKRALKGLSGKSGDDLMEAVADELDRQRKANRTAEERAITEEFNQHIRTLRKVWHKDLLPHLIN